MTELTARVTIENTGESYACAGDTALLDAALAAGIDMPHNCRGGACGTCKARLLEGKVDHGWGLSFALGEEEKTQGYCLACQSKPLASTIRLRMVNPMKPAAEAERAIVPIEAEAELVAAHPVAPATMRLVVALARTMRFHYRAGMNMEFLLPGQDIARPYSIANAPDPEGLAPDGLLVFYVSRHPHGQASSWLHANAIPGTRLALRGPYGDFRLPVGTAAPLLCLAGGTGIAPLLAIVEDALRAGFGAPIELLFSVRERREIFALDTLAGLARRYPNFAYLVALTRDPGAQAGFAQGRIPARLAEEARDLSSHTILIAGPPGFVDACAAAAAARGAPAERVLLDSFLPRGRLPSPVPESAGEAPRRLAPPP